MDPRPVLWIDLRAHRTAPSAYAQLRERCIQWRPAHDHDPRFNTADALDRAISRHAPALVCFECDACDAWLIEHARSRHPAVTMLRFTDVDARKPGESAVRGYRDPLDLQAWPNHTPRPARTQAAMHYLQTQFDQRVTLQAAAEHCHMSKYEFSRVFKKEHGATFVDVVLRLRAERACELLRAREASVKSVAFAVGFNGVSYFGRMFRRYYGLTPHQYQIQVQAGSPTAVPPSADARRDDAMIALV